MRSEIYLQKSSNLFMENRLLKFVILVLALAVGANTFFVYKAVKYQRIILIPPRMTDTIEFVHGQPSEKYVRDMARRIVSLAATYSPATARKQFNELLALYDPETYPQASKTWYALAGRVEESHISNVFYMSNIVLDSAENRMEISGEQKQFADDRLIETARKTFVVQYRLEDGRFFLLSFMEKWQEKDFSR